MTFLTGMETFQRDFTFTLYFMFMTFLTGMETPSQKLDMSRYETFMTFLTGMETIYADISEMSSNVSFMTFLTGMETKQEIQYKGGGKTVYDLPNRDGNKRRPAWPRS